jgi:hypothetical protein
MWIRISLVFLEVQEIIKKIKSQHLKNTCHCVCVLGRLCSSGMFDLLWVSKMLDRHVSRIVEWGHFQWGGTSMIVRAWLGSGKIFSFSILFFSLLDSGFVLPHPKWKGFLPFVLYMNYNHHFLNCSLFVLNYFFIFLFNFIHWWN